MSNRHRCRAEHCREHAPSIYTLPRGVKVRLCPKHAAYLQHGMVPPLKPHAAPVGEA